MGAEYKQGVHIQENIDKDKFLNIPGPKYLLDYYSSYESKIPIFK